MAKKITSYIPNTITCMNLVCGAVAVINAFKGNHHMLGGLTGFEWCYIFIGIAAVCDFFDGAAARALKAYSALGKELDSLSDLVSFGIAPGMLIYNTMMVYGTSDILPYLALYIPVAGELRLAAFNLDDRQTTSFLGMPIPANAIFWIGMSAAIHKWGYPGDWMMAVVIVVIASLMLVTRMKMFSLKFKNFSLSDNLLRYTIIVATILFVALEGVAGFAWTILFYIALSFVPAKP